MKLKKIITGLFLAFLLINSVSCSPKKETMKFLEGKEGVFAEIQTSKGTIIVELYYKKTPLTVINFVGLAEGTLDAAKGKKFYDGLKFHRVISLANGDNQDFMIQGGDPLGTGSGDPGYKFADEFVEELTFDKPGVLAMANSGKNTNGSQFFITIVPTQWLNYKHTIFGQVLDGQKVVDTMKQNDVIKSIQIIRKGSEAEKFTATQKDFDEAEKQLEIKQKEEYEKAVAEAKKYYEGVAKKVTYKVLKEGKGEKVGFLKKVAVEYKGMFQDGSVFDQSEGRGPLEFITGAGQMIPGFDAMVQDMKLGEKRKITLPPETAYGEQGAGGGVIPPNATIVFEVELVEIN